jgi:hypothetical protein
MTDQKQVDFNFACFISDIGLPQEFVNVLRNFNVKHMSYDAEVFLNHDFAFFEKEGVNVIWININDLRALQWLQQNVHSPSKYHLVNIYKVRSSFNKWLEQLDKTVENTLSYKSLMSVKSINIVDFISKIVNFSKISKPKGCFKRVLMFILKKLGV